VWRQFQYRQVAIRVHTRALFEILAVEPIYQACSSVAEWTTLQIAASGRQKLAKKLKR
jgi:hypothetical protein